MRTPRISPPAVDVQPRNDIITQVRTYHVVTPLFGGGVEAGVCDPITPIRGTAIRGHLRFWWRACRGGQFGYSLDAMKAAEDAIWGAAANTKKEEKSNNEPKPKPLPVVQVFVQVSNDGKDVHPFEVVQAGRNPKPRPRQGSSVPVYAAFPLQPTDEECRRGGIGMPTRAVREGIGFSLTITFPEQHRADVEAALWAWETFGGIGARTRRGFGALWLESEEIERPSRPDAVDAWIRQKLQQHVVVGSYPDNVPHLSREPRFMCMHQGSQDASKIWKSLIERFQEFRQHRSDKNIRERKFGHSDWPEPDAIRLRLGHDARGRLRINAFPRAQLGLPIVFHIPKEGISDVMLQGKDKDKERLSSPLILKPFAYQADKAVGLALVLDGVDLPEPLVLTGKKVRDGSNISTEVSSQQAERIKPLDGESDVLQAFLNFLNTN